MNSHEEYTEDYYERGEELGISGYTDYHWMPTRTLETASELIRRANIKKNDTILDFGCAKGFLVKAFRWLGYKAHGCDISKYAVEHCDEEVKEYIYSGDMVYGHNQWDIIICKDVLEHIEEDKLYHYLKYINGISRKAIFIIPLGNGKKYNIPRFEKDITHKIRQPMGWWIKRLNQAGFKIEVISDNMKRIKPNWNVPLGNVYIGATK